MRRAGFTLVEFMVAVTVLTCAIILTFVADPQQAHRLDDRFGLIPLGFVLLWGVGLAIRDVSKDPTRSCLVIAAVVAIVCPLVNRWWGMYVKEWLLTSKIAPFYWEALLTFVMSLPMMLALGLLFSAAFRRNGQPADVNRTLGASKLQSEKSESNAELADATSARIV